MSKSEIDPKRFLSKKRLKQTLMLVGILLITLAFSGCEKLVETDVSAETKSTIQTVSETTNFENITEIKTIEPPKDGWTLEQLNKVLYMNEQKIELPLMFSSLKEGYEIRDKRYNNELSLDNDIVGGLLYYQNDLIALVTFYELETDIEFLSLYFFPDMYVQNNNNIKYININGFELQDNINDVCKYLGDKYIKENELLIYTIENGNYYIKIPNTKNFWISIDKINKENDKHD